MKRLRLQSPINKRQEGFIPMLLSILAIVLAGVVFVYLRVMHAQ